MANVRIKNTVVDAGIKSAVPHVQSSRATVSTESTGTAIVVGNPIGLLLALTYADPHSGGTTITNVSDYKPNVRITTN